MNAPVRASAAPLLDHYPYRLTDNVRFADLDPNGHVNNAVYATYFETGRVTLVKDRSFGLMPEGLGWVLVRPNFDQVVFSEGKCVASAQATTVLIDEATRKPVPLTSEIKANFQRWLRRGYDGK